MPILTRPIVENLRKDMREDMLRQLPLYELASQFVAPNRLKTDPSVKNNGIRKDSKIIKNVAGKSLRTFISGMSDGSTPSTRFWFEQVVPNQDKARQSSSKKYLAESRDGIHQYLQLSNFYRVMPMAYKDVGLFSNAAFAMLPHPKFGFWFYPFAMGTYGFACNAEGDADTFYRDFCMNIRQVVMSYGQKLPGSDQIDWSNIPAFIKEHWDRQDYLKTVVLTHVIAPNRDYNPATAKRLDPTDKKYQSYIYVQSMAGMGAAPLQTNVGFRGENGIGSKDFLKVTGSNYFNVIIPRWEVGAEENWGNSGPTEVAISDIMTYHEMEKFRLEAIAKMVRPPMVGPSSLRRHAATILAGGITYSDAEGQAQQFRPAFEMDPKLSELLADQSEYVDAIRSAYYEDLFAMFSGQDTKSHVTEREISLRDSEKLSIMSPALGQLNQDCNSKVISMAHAMLEEQQRLPQRPKELAGEQFRPEYISSLALASKASKMTSLERLGNFAGSLATALQDPALLRVVKGEKALRRYSESMGTDPDLISTEEEMGEIRAQIAQQQAQQAQQAAAAQNAKTMKDLSGAKTGEGSLLDKMTAEEE